MTGIPFQTVFTLKVDKQPAFFQLKCEFGYFNAVGKVILPTEDTGDFLIQREEHYNNNLVLIKTIFPSNETISVFC